MYILGYFIILLWFTAINRWENARNRNHSGHLSYLHFQSL